MDVINDEIKRLEAEGVAEEFAKAALDHEENNPPAEAVAVFESDPEVLGVLTGFTTMICSSLAPNWDVEPEENSMIAEAFEMVLDKYMPGVKDNVGVEFALVMAIGGVVLSRFGKPLKIEREAIADENIEKSTADKQQIYNDDKSRHIIDLGAH
ncbi:MAG: hypothetical protein ISEC1_P1944 [Thiomicrorhabdus sp.]|nr:MAG: hypothetical protein ISEC1_P1944 [Thiomicrorhabdus sp.]